MIGAVFLVGFSFGWVLSAFFYDWYWFKYKRETPK